MDYLDFGDNIDYNKYNALVYLLRKFKKLTSNLTLGAYRLESDYGTFNFSDGFVNVGNNWILENPVTVTSNDVLKNTFYTFNFVVIDVNTTGTVNRRIVSVTEGTGETGTLELTIPSDLIGTDEVILPNFTMEVVFDEHEYYTQLPDINLSLSVDKMGIEEGEVATITGLLTDSTSTPIENVSLPLNVDGTTVTVITDSTGEFNYAYTGTGTRGKVLVSALGESVFFYDGLIGIMGAIVTGNNVSLGWGSANWLITTGDVVIDWGDGTSDTVNNPNVPLSHIYSDGLSEHLIIFDGTVTSLGVSCFRGGSGLTSVTILSSVTSLGDLCFYNCSGLTSVTIPDSVTSLGKDCFNGCSGLTSVTIPDSVTSLGSRCFERCSGLIEYELYWETQPIQYDSRKMPVNNNTVFTIPYGTTSIYTDAGYPLDKLVEREPSEPIDTVLTITSDKQSIYTDETIIITGTLLDENNNPVKQASVKLYDGNTLLDTLTTDNNGNYTKTITGLSSGSHSLHASFEATTIYNASTSSNITITVSEHNYNLVLSSDTPIIQKTGTAVVNALLSIDGSAYSSQSLSYTVKHGSTTIDTGTVTTGSDGKASISYTGTGVGDVSVEVSYSTLLQKTYEIIDSLLYLPSEVSQQGQSGGDYFTPYDDNMSLTLPNKFELSFKFKSTSSASRFILAPVQYKTSNIPNYVIGIQQTSDIRVGLYRTTNTLAVGSDTSIDGTVYHEWKIIRNGNTFQWYFDGVQVNSDVNLTWFDNYTPHLLGFQYWYTGTMTVKDILIKAL